MYLVSLVRGVARKKTLGVQMLNYVIIFRKKKFGWKYLGEIDKNLGWWHFLFFSHHLKVLILARFKYSWSKFDRKKKKSKTGHYPKFLSISLIFYHSSSKSQVKSKQRWLFVSTSANHINFIKFQQIWLKFRIQTLNISEHGPFALWLGHWVCH